MNLEKSARRSRQPKATCRCGRCPACVEDARWERIFQEKFADPAYYRRNDFRTSSPLVDL